MQTVESVCSHDPRLLKADLYSHVVNGLCGFPECVHLSLEYNGEIRIKYRNRPDDHLRNATKIHFRALCNE